MKKLLIVRNEAKAEQLRKVLDNVDVKGYGAALGGRGYDVIMLVDQPFHGSEAERDRYLEYLEVLKLKLFSKDSEIIQVY